MSVEVLENRIIYARSRYYNYGDSPYTDQEYDAMINALEILKPESFLLKEIGYRPEGKFTKVYRTASMFTLRKLRTKEELTESIKSIVEKYDSISIYPKYDGASCSLIYKYGKLTLASTRGDGNVGEDVTKFAWICPSIPKLLHGRLSSEPYLEIRGECIFPKELTDELRERGYSSLRNTAAGVMRSANIDLCLCLKFIAYEASYEGKTNRQFMESALQNEFTVENLLYHVESGVPSYLENTLEFIDSFNKDNYSYELDGIVLKPDVMCDWGAKEPVDILAYKYDTEVKSTVISGITTEVGVTGKINVVYKLDPPVEFQGAKITNVSAGSLQLHNERWKAQIGDICSVTRVNDVIPKMVSISNVSENAFIPINDCPCCGSSLESHKCPNEHCEDKLRQRLFLYVKSLKIPGLTQNFTDKLFNKGYKLPHQLYEIPEETLALLPRVTSKAHNGFKKLLSMKLSFNQFLLSYPFADIGPTFINALTDTYSEAEILSKDFQPTKGIDGVKYYNFLKQLDSNYSDIIQTWRYVKNYGQIK